MLRGRFGGGLWAQQTRDLGIALWMGPNWWESMYIEPIRRRTLNSDTHPVSEFPSEGRRDRVSLEQGRTVRAANMSTMILHFQNQSTSPLYLISWMDFHETLAEPARHGVMAVRET